MAIADEFIEKRRELIGERVGEKEMLVKLLEFQKEWLIKPREDLGGYSYLEIALARKKWAMR